MIRHQFQNRDNRDSSEMYNYLESRITVLKQRIFDLEMENATLRCQLEDSRIEVVEANAQEVEEYFHSVQTTAS